jgi:hypothetical protein
MVRRALTAAALGGALSTIATPVFAQEGPSSPAPTRSDAPVAPAEEPAPRPAVARPRLLHAPVTVADAHEHILIYADVIDPELLKHAAVVYRVGDGKEERSIDLLRSPKFSGYVAEIPAADVRAPSVSYTIEFELTNGERVSAFASRSAMQRVAVAEDYLDLRKDALLQRLHGRRTVVSAEAEYVSFGNSEGRLFDPNTGTELATVPDRYYRIEGAFAYRFLGAVTEFGSRMGVLRGQAPSPYASTVRGNDAFDVGLDYIAPSVRLRLTDGFHVDLEGLTGLTEERFRVGALSRLLIGDPYGSKLVLGVQGIDGFGVRFWSRVDITANQALTVSPIIEATNWPHADAYGVRLLLELAFDLGSGAGVVVGGGYQARQATSGGASGTLSLRYAF